MANLALHMKRTWNAVSQQLDFIWLGSLNTTTNWASYPLLDVSGRGGKEPGESSSSGKVDFASYHVQRLFLRRWMPLGLSELEVRSRRGLGR
jgi:hypothetical protein